MSRVEAAAADRLPWLSDEPKPIQAKRRSGRLVGWSAAALTAVTAAGFWIGVRSVQEQPAPAPRHASPSATVQLPAPRPVEPVVKIPVQPQVSPAPAPQVRQAPAREVRIATPSVPKAEHREAAKDVSVSEEQAKAEAPPVVAQPKPQPAVPKPWNPRIFAGAAGRVVQVGAFGSIQQAKLGWRYMARAYPAMSRLPAVVRPTHNSHGRTFYRFQIGTTSQAHSEVLCQRMEKIRFSCAVVGLPWKAKVER
jgi:hypothetical protein